MDFDKEILSFLVVENNQNLDLVEWTTADPVTGTVVRYGYISGGNIETEPLGQKISNEDTADAPTPQNGGSVGLKSVKDPYSQQINYGFDRIGRLSGVTGNPTGGGRKSSITNRRGANGKRTIRSIRAC